MCIRDRSGELSKNDNIYIGSRTFKKFSNLQKFPQYTLHNVTPGLDIKIHKTAKTVGKGKPLKNGQLQAAHEATGLTWEGEEGTQGQNMGWRGKESLSSVYTGLEWYWMVFDGIWWYSMVLYGIEFTVWYSMVFNGIGCYNIVLDGI